MLNKFKNQHTYKSVCVFENQRAAKGQCNLPYIALYVPCHIALYVPYHKVKSMSLTIPRRDRSQQTEGFHKLWHEVAGGVAGDGVPTTMNPKWWDRFQMAMDVVGPRRWDSMRGRQKPTIIQLKKNVITNPFKWALYAYPRMYAREEHVVDWSGIEQRDLVQYFYGMSLRYGIPQEWPKADKEEMDYWWPIPSGDKNVYRIGPPPGFRHPEEFNGRPPVTQYIFPSFGGEGDLIFNPDSYDCVVTDGLPPIGFVTMWQEKDDVWEKRNDRLEREAREKYKCRHALRKRFRELQEKYGVAPAKKTRNEPLSSSEDDDDEETTDDDDDACCQC